MATATDNNTSTTLEAQPRAAGNKNVARRVRRGGKIPAVVYGAGKQAASVSVDPRQVLRILHSETGHNTIFDLSLDGGERAKAMIVDWQYEPIKGKLLHIDLKRIAMDQRLKVMVPIELKGEPAGVKQQGGLLEQMLREVEVECLPADIPSFIEADVSELVFGKVLREVEIECLPADIPGHIDVDVTELTFGKLIRVEDLPHSEKLKFLTDANQMVAHIVSVKEVVEETAVAAVDATAAPTEPEVAKKGKQDAEGAEGAAPAADKGGDKKKDKK